ncbi:hypothetical protein F8388_003551 [Cannabis sativa]|uniref:Terpene synthase n=1 Tax=Cannabis sativa TaxID=3483 RepID=A0A7J6EM97_CANSA|nr:hypothetical protein F8388_003551 [Cannabis sativa]
MITELELLTEAVKRWDINEIDKLNSGYFQVFYKELLICYEEFEQGLTEETYRVHYAKEVLAWWLKKAERIPSFDEYLKFGLVNCGYLMLTFEKEKYEELSAVECYMKQYGVSEEETYDELNKRVFNAWKEINEDYFLKPTYVASPILDRALNLSRARADVTVAFVEKELRVDACHVLVLLDVFSNFDFVDRHLIEIVSMELEPENVTKIIGYLLLNDNDDQQFLRLASAQEHFVHQIISKAKTELQLLASISVSNPLSPSINPTSGFSPFSSTAISRPKLFSIFKYHLLIGIHSLLRIRTLRFYKWNSMTHPWNMKTLPVFEFRGLDGANKFSSIRIRDFVNMEVAVDILMGK